MLGPTKNFLNLHLDQIFLLQCIILVLSFKILIRVVWGNSDRVLMCFPLYRRPCFE